LPQNFTSPVNQTTGKNEHNVFDANRNLTESHGPDNAVAGPATTWSYNLSGAHPFFPDSATNPQGQTLNFSYDSTSAASPNLQSVGVQGQTGLLANNTYDTTIKGQVNKSTDANGHDTTYGYETLAPYSSGGGDLKTITPPLPQGATTLGHDGLSRITTVKDGLAQTTTYHYDGDDRVTEIDYPDSTYVTFTYDGDGNVTQVYDSSGAQTETYGYDRKNRLTSDSGATGNDTYTYDAGDNLKTIADGGGTVSYAYDAADNACWAYVGSSSNTCASPPSGATTFSYDSNDNRTHTNYPSSVDMATTFDNDDRVTEIKATKSGVTTPLTDFAYTYVESTTDRDRRATVLDTGNGNNNKTFYTYTGKGFLQEAQTKNSGGSGSVISDLGYSYDSNGNLCWTYPGNPPTGTGIDCGHPPTGTTKTYTYDNANELCWSIAGPSTNACSSPPSGATTYTFDADGQQTAQSGRGTITLNKRHQTTSLFGTSMGYFGPDNALRLTSGTSSFKYNALGLGTKTASGSSAYYTRDPGGQLLSDRTTAGTYNYLFDGLGSIVALTDSTGAVAKRYSYDPYGTVTAGTGSVDNPWQYASGYYDSGLNTVKFGQRYYDPTIARWTQTDPIDAVGIQQANRYLYVASDPLNATDPTGEDLSQTANQAVRGATYCNTHPASCRALQGRATTYKRQHWRGRTPSVTREALWCAAGSLAGPLGCAAGAGASAGSDVLP
jgi:RHS repeat-associated protein